MSFAALKKSSKANFASLVEKVEKEGSKKWDNDEGFWSPNIDKGGNGYAVIRFLPAADGDDMPYVKTYSHGFKNEVGRWFIENCPTTIGGKCPVCDANNKLWNAGGKANQDTVRTRKRNLRYVANILVISDPKNPENDGKVFLFRFGQKIFEKIMGAIKPEFEDETPFNPFDFWEGANFKLKIRNFEGYRNYDKSEFEAPSALLDGDDEALEALWKQQKSLKPLIDPSQFKSYDAIKRKFDEIVNAAMDDDEDSGFDDFEDEDEENDEPAKPAPTRSKPAAKKVEKESEDDDDDLAMYAKLLES